MVKHSLVCACAGDVAEAMKVACGVYMVDAQLAGSTEPDLVPYFEKKAELCTQLASALESGMEVRIVPSAAL